MYVEILLFGEGPYTSDEIGLVFDPRLTNFTLQLLRVKLLVQTKKTTQDEFGRTKEQRKRHGSRVLAKWRENRKKNLRFSWVASQNSGKNQRLGQLRGCLGRARALGYDHVPGYNQQKPVAM